MQHVRAFRHGLEHLRQLQLQNKRVRQQLQRGR